MNTFDTIIESMPNIYSSHKNGNLSRLKCFGMLNFKCLCIVAIEKVFFPYKDLHTLRYEAGQFLLTIIYTICTWIKINILYMDKKFFMRFLCLVEPSDYIHPSRSRIPQLLFQLLKRNNCVKSTQPLWCIIYKSRTYATVRISFPHNCL